jgi:hypothetical protein
MTAIDNLTSLCTQLLDENIEIGKQIKLSLIEIRELKLRLEEIEILKPIIER